MRRTFSSGTQDCANKFVASEAVFGTSTVHPIPDLEHTDLCLVIGENPRASQASFYSIPNVLGELRRATARGARIVFVNPRRIETPERGVGDTVLIRPDTDVWFLAALLHEIDALGGFDAGVIARHGTPRRRAAGVPRRVPAPTAVAASPASTPTSSASWRRRGSPRRGRRSTPRPGINMGRQGSLAYWLVHMLSFVTGRLDVEGGNLKSDGFYANAESGAGVPEQGYVDTEFGRLRRGALPGTLMADAILDSAEPVRAMIVVAGNPLLSIAGEERLRKAFEQLELLVVIDIYPSATAELADVVLPCTDMYERDDLNIVNIGTSARPFAQYTPAVVAPAARTPAGVVDRPPPAAGARRSRRSSTTTSPDPWAKWRHMLQRGAGVELADLQATGDVRRAAAADAGRVLRQAGVDRRRPRRLLPAVVRRRHRALPRPVRRGLPRTRDAAAPDPRPRPVDAQHVVRQRAADEARRPHVQPAGDQPRRRRRARARRRRPGRRRPATTARSPPTSPSTTS